MNILPDGPPEVQAGAETAGTGAPAGHLLFPGPSPVAVRSLAWVGSIGSGGCWVDAEPCDRSCLPDLAARAIRGSGVETSLTLCRSGAACRDAARVFGDAGLEAAVYPSRTPFSSAEHGARSSGPDGVIDAENQLTGNCKNFDEIEQARSLGLPPTAAVCLDCAHKKECEDPDRQDLGYLAQLAAAGGAAHGVMTNGRAEYTDLEKDCRGRGAVLFTGGNTLDVLRPTIRVKSDGDAAASHLDAITEAARRCYDRTGFFQVIGNLSRVLLISAGRGGGGGVNVSAAVEWPRDWARRFRRELGGVRPSPELRGLVRVCTLNALGRLDGPVYLATHEGAVLVHASLPTRRFNRPVVIHDAEVTAGDVAAAMGVEALTVVWPGARPAAGVVQVAERTTGGKSAGRVARIVREHLARVTGKVGVVSVKKLRHRAEMALSRGELERVVFSGWYGGTDSLRACELMVFLGEPPVPDDEVSKRLFQTGRSDAALRERGWVRRPWEAETASGWLVVPRRGYADEEWQEVRTRVLAGRLHSVLAGLPGRVVVYSAEELGLPVLDHARRRKILVAFAGPLEDDHKLLICKNLDSIGQNAFNTLFEEINDPFLFGIKSVLADAREVLSTKELSRLTGIPERTMQRELARLESVGTVTRVGLRGGWRLTTAI